MKNYKFTVFTPCYNGSASIKRVFDSMLSQTYSNWEWIIVDDGSVDDSADVINKLLMVSGLKNVIVLHQSNMGKHISWNKAVKLASGDFFVPADCDDFFTADTLFYFNSMANELRHDDFCSSDLSGISVCCYEPESDQLVGTPFPYDGLICDQIELDYKFHVTGEKWGCVRTDLLKKFPFPEIPCKYYSENYIWYSFSRAGYKKANFNKKLRAYFYEPQSLTHNMSYRLDPQIVAMQKHYTRWLMSNIGPIIGKYSFIERIKIIKRYLRVCVKSVIINMRRNFVRG